MINYSIWCFLSFFYFLHSNVNGKILILTFFELYTVTMKNRTIPSLFLPLTCLNKDTSVLLKVLIFEQFHKLSIKNDLNFLKNIIFLHLIPWIKLSNLRKKNKNTWHIIAHLTVFTCAFATHLLKSS